MRRIKFRGKVIDRDEWIYGYINRLPFTADPEREPR